MAKNYPADITVHGHKAGRIHQGHGHDYHSLLADMEESNPTHPVKDILVEEVHLDYKPRVMYCSNYDGFGCDYDGEWHSHWFEVRGGTDTAYTLVSWEE